MTRNAEQEKGQILRVATFHFLFHRDTPLNVPENISEEAVKAAVRFVDLCLQHVAYMAGRGGINEAIQALESSWLN